jgi:hypothetical protein
LKHQTLGFGLYSKENNIGIIGVGGGVGVVVVVGDG